jgi:hypothetical protein
VKLRPPLGPVGARKPAGPLGGDLGATGRTGDLSRGVDLAESLSLCAGCTGERSRVGGERVLGSRVVACVKCSRSGWMGGEERRDVVPEVLSDDLSESRAGGEGDRRLQFVELGPVGTRSSRRSALRERPRYAALGPAGGERRGIGDLARGAGRSRSYGDLDLRLLVT